MNKKLIDWWNDATPNRWNQSIEIPVTVSERWLTVPIVFQDGMKADYSDLRFCIDPDGTTEEKTFLRHWVETSDAFGATVHVGFKTAPAVSSTFKCLYGNQYSTSFSNAKATAQVSDWFANDFSSSGLLYDIHHAFQGYDQLIAGDLNGEENHASGATSPINNDMLLWYKDDDENVHPGAATGKILFIRSSDNGITWTAPETVFDPVGANGAMNVVGACINYNGIERKVAICNYQVAGGGGDQSEIRIWLSIKDDNGAWSSPVNLSSLVGLDEVTFGGAQGMATHDGIIMLMTHRDQLSGWKPTLFYSRDYGVNWDYVEISSPVNTQLNETWIIQLKTADQSAWQNRARLFHRNEDLTNTREHFYETDITWDATTVTVGTTKEARVCDTAKNRGWFVRMKLPKGDRIFCFYGTTRIKGFYSDDELETTHPIPYYIADGNVYSANRCYPVMWDRGNGKMPVVWSTNKLSGGSDLYLQFFDANLMQLRTMSTTTLTDSRPRPTVLNPGVRIGDPLVPNFRTTSSTNNAVPTTHPTLVTFIVNDPNLSYNPAGGQTVICRRLSAAYFVGTTVSYNSSTNELVVSSTSHVGSGSGTTWIIDLTSNLLAEQVYISYFERNGKVNGYRIKGKMRSNDAASSIVGTKKIETRATGVQTVTNAGAAGNEVTLEWRYNAGAYLGLHPVLGKVATYTVQSGDTIADVVAGLVASANQIGICPVVTSDATTLTVMAPRGQGANINTLTLNVVTTGSVAVSSGAFSGGATEAVSNFFNQIVFGSNTTANMEQANDGYTQAQSNTQNVFHDYEIKWEPDLITMTVDGANAKTKTPANGSGICDWMGAVTIFVTTNNANPQTYVEGSYIFCYPLDTSVGSLGSPVAGNWTERADGLGLN